MADTQKIFEVGYTKKNAVNNLTKLAHEEFESEAIDVCTHELGHEGGERQCPPLWG